MLSCIYMYRISKDNKIAILARQREVIFHTQDLMVLWGLYNKNTLYTTIKRYCQQGVLFRIQKGMYSIVPINEIDPWLLGVMALRGHAYISTESILAKEGIINQLSDKITLVSNKSLKFKIAGYNFVSRKIADRFLVNSTGIIEKQGVKQAGLVRAVADMLYFNPHFHFDNRKLVDWRAVKKVQQEVGY